MFLVGPIAAFIAVVPSESVSGNPRVVLKSCNVNWKYLCRYNDVSCAKENNKKAGAKFRQIFFSHNLCLCLLPCDLYLFSGPIFLLCFLTVDPEEEKQILSWMEQAKNPSASRVSTNWSMLLEYLKLKLIPYFTLWEVISTSKVRSFRICRVLALQLPPASKRGKV